jgi:hypothetical protein
VARLEAEARDGERSEEFDAEQQRYAELFGEPTLLDLREPMLD